MRMARGTVKRRREAPEGPARYAQGVVGVAVALDCFFVRDGIFILAYPNFTPAECHFFSYFKECIKCTNIIPTR